MIKLLIRKTIKRHEEIHDRNVRKAYGVLGGILGIVCNSILFVLKLVIGILMSSIAIISDAFNNLSDMGSSIISIFSAKMATKRPDKEHPFGHGRIEYICSLVVSFIIVFVGFQLAINSVTKLTAMNNDVVFSWWMIGILSVSILVKVWMFFYNRYLARKIDSSVLRATAFDSLSDVLTSSVIIIAMIVGHLWLPRFPLDGIMGTIVAIIIIINGVKLIISTSDDLLGRKADKETIEVIEKIVMQGEGILGIHDLIVHDYGPGRKMATIHAEIANDSDIVMVHEAIDALEEKIEEELGIHMVIHMDPITVGCEKTDAIKEHLCRIVHDYDQELKFHDLRITDGVNRINIIFDLVIPYSYDRIRIKAINRLISDKLKEIDKAYNVVIKIDFE